MEELITQVFKFRKEMYRLKKQFAKINETLPRCPGHSAREVQDMLIFLIEFIFLFSNCYLYFTFKEPSSELHKHFVKARLASQIPFSLFDARPNFVCLTRLDLDPSLAECKLHLQEFLNLLKNDAQNTRLIRQQP
eukprot:TRINITY_DN34968_c0_g1_i1.p1 TRINITY_DN34968_c0_g1~~TRINITY_DN34968_c0_g1_i1.p1  ORF type:complete len:154 (+),score=35.22 TRINITY_DN34968_c0_g1_i1:58-462(+)